MKDFFRFCLWPQWTETFSKKGSRESKFLGAFSIVVFCYIASTGINLLVQLFLSHYGFSEIATHNSSSGEGFITGIANGFNENDFLSFLMLLGMTTLVAPVIEELIFRWPLKLQKYSLLFFAFIITSLLWLILLNETFLKAFSNSLDTISWNLLFFVPVCTLVGLLFYIQKYWLTSTQNFLKKYYPLFTWLLILSFCFVHVVNNEDIVNGSSITLPHLATILYTLPIAFGFTYLRIYYGLLYSIIAHVIINSLASILILYLLFFDFIASIVQ